jgi:carotenoid cleavage dioxygenase-like enzyme
MLMFWEAIVSVILSKKVCMHMRPIPNGFRVPKLLIRKRYYVLFLMPVFIAQVTKLLQFAKYNKISKFPPSTSVLFATHVRTWRVARRERRECSTTFLYALISESVRGRRHVHVHFLLLRMTDTMTSKNTDFISWDTLHTYIHTYIHTYVHK